MAPAGPAFLVVGQLSRVHGTRGELFVWPLTDYPEATFVPGARFRVAARQGGGRSGEQPDEGLPPLVVDQVRSFKEGYLVLFEGISSRTEAELLRERYLLKPVEELEPLAEDEIFYHELLGARVLLVDGTEVGRIQEVYHLQPVDLIEVRRPGGTLLVPYTREIVVSVDREAGEIRIDPPEGLLDL